MQDAEKQRTYRRAIVGSVLVVLAIVSGVLAWRVSHVVVDIDSPHNVPALTDWRFFHEFWEEASVADCSYAAVSDVGEVRFYKLREGYRANPRISFYRLPVLAGAVEQSADGLWNLALVDCSTGRVAYWEVSEEVVTSFEEAEERGAESLEGMGAVALGDGRWVAFAHAPVLAEPFHLSAYGTTGPWDEAAAYNEVIEGVKGDLDAADEGDASAISELVARCRFLAEGGETYGARLVVASARGELLDALCEEYGTDTIERWREEAPMSEGEGFEAYIRWKWPELSGEAALEAYASTGRVDYGWVS